MSGMDEILNYKHLHWTATAPETKEKPENDEINEENKLFSFLR